MQPRHRWALLTAGSLVALTLPAGAASLDRVTTANGVVVGAAEEAGVRAFRGIPFAAPPVGDLRWKPPQPVTSWKDARPAETFGPRCLQRRIPCLSRNPNRTG